VAGKRCSPRVPVVHGMAYVSRGPGFEPWAGRLIDVRRLVARGLAARRGVDRLLLVGEGWSAWQQDGWNRNSKCLMRWWRSSRRAAPTSSTCSSTARRSSAGRPSTAARTQTRRTGPWRTFETIEPSCPWRSASATGSSSSTPGSTRLARRSGTRTSSPCPRSSSTGPPTTSRRPTGACCSAR
jgi:hypothetical protein